MIKKSKASKRKYQETGVSLLEGGEGKFTTILFRGKKYYFYRQAYLKGKGLFKSDGSEAKPVVAKLRSYGYKVRLTKATRDGVIVNIYTSPQVPNVPHKKPIFG